MAARKSGLGRGLDALIPRMEEGPKQGFRMVSVDQLAPNPHQPRTSFDQEGLESLAASIREVGLLQPVVVRSISEGGFILVAGERRWRAARMAGLSEIPALVREGEESGFLAEALVENLQREDLSDLAEAGAYQQLLEDFGLTHEAIGRRVGKSRAAVTNSLRLLGLPAAIQGMLERGELSAGHARALLGLEDAKYAEHVARRAASEGWSVRQVEESVRSRQPSRSASGDRRPVRPAPILELEQRLAERLGTGVRIDYRGKAGTLKIRFGSLDDLERIYRSLFGS